MHLMSAMTNVTRVASISSKRIALLHTTAIRSTSSIAMVCHERLTPASYQNPQSIRMFSSPVANDNVNNHDLATILLLLTPPSAQNTDPSPDCDSSETGEVPSPARRSETATGNQEEGRHQHDDNYKLKLKKKAALSRFFL